MLHAVVAIRAVVAVSLGAIYFTGSAYAQKNGGSNVEMSIIKPEGIEKVERLPFKDRPSLKATEGKDATFRTTRDFVSADGKLTAGIAQFDKMTVEVVDFPVDEYMHLIEGEVEITDNAGKVTKFKAGDSFVMPKGFTGTFRQLTPMKKFAVTYTPGD